MKEKQSKSVEKAAPQKPSFGYALGVFAMIIAILLVGSIILKQNITLLMFIAFIATIPLVMKLGYSYSEAEGLAFDAIPRVFGIIFILFAVGALVGSWAASGTLAVITHTGLSLVNPSFFYVTALFLCTAASIATGTSWGTVSTVGIAMMVVAGALDMSPAITAGAIISGAWFGDKISPLSDAVAFASAVSGAKVLDHIHHMLYTGIPAYVISAVLYAILGLRHGSATGDVATTIQPVLDALEANYRLGFIPAIPIIVVFGLLIMRKPAFPSIFLGALTALPISCFYQGNSIGVSIDSMLNGFAADLGRADLNQLMSSKGMMGMLGTITLILIAVSLGNLLDASGILEAMLQPMLKLAQGPRSVVLLSIATALMGNVIGASAAFSSVITGATMQPLYRKYGLAPENLSRVVSDVSTASEPAIPWTGSAVFVAGTLGVSTMQYLPFMFFSILVFVITTAFAIFDITIKRADPEQAAKNA